LEAETGLEKVINITDRLTINKPIDFELGEKRNFFMTFKLFSVLAAILKKISIPNC
jgi:hypothetical protein